MLVIVDVKPKNIGLPTEAYRAVEEIHDDGSPATKTFEHVPSEIGAEEAEEVGVEHLLRDIKDTTVGTLSQKVTNQMMGLKGLHSKLADMRNYVQQVLLVTDMGVCKGSQRGTCLTGHQHMFVMKSFFDLNTILSVQQKCHFKY